MFAFFNTPYDWAIVALLALLFFGEQLPTILKNLSMRCQRCGWRSIHPTHCLHCGWPKHSPPSGP
jgi:hypothetical protein